MTKLFVRCFYILFIVLSFWIVNARGFAQETPSEEESLEEALPVDTSIDSATATEINLLKGELETIKVYSLTRISITDPNIADVSDAQENEVVLIGKSAGQTPLFIWDEKGKRILTVHVFNQNLDLIKSRIEKLLEDAELTEAIMVNTNPKEQKVVVSGKIPKDKRDEFSKIIDLFFEDVINLAKEEKSNDLVQIDMQITELSATLLKSLGLNWSSSLSNSTTFGSTGTSQSTTNSGANSADLNANYQETLPNQDGSIGDLFKIGDFRRLSVLNATLNALILEGKARVLSQPKLVVVSGEEAKFLVGGEIPIKTTTTSTSGSTQENVQFKEYGVGMTVLPTIREGKVDIVLNVEISDIDASNPSGDDVAFVTRTASTRLYLDDGQLIILAGLIRKADSESAKRVPFLSKLPIIGVLFVHRYNVAPDTDQEVVISLTPHILFQTKKSPKKFEDSLGVPQQDLEVQGEPNEEVLEPQIETPESVETSLEEPDVAEAEASDSDSQEDQDVAVKEEPTPAATTPEPQIEAEQPVEAVSQENISELSVPVETPPQVSTSVPSIAVPEPETTSSLTPLKEAVPSAPIEPSNVVYSNIPKEMIEYVRSIQEKIASAIIYPTEAEEFGWEGTVKATLLIFRDGTLGSVNIKESSGFEVFDDDIIETVKRVAPFSGFPSNSDLRELNVTIPIVYSLKK